MALLSSHFANTFIELQLHTQKWERQLHSSLVTRTSPFYSFLERKINLTSLCTITFKMGVKFLPAKMVGFLNIERKEKARIKYLVFEPNIDLRSSVTAHTQMTHFSSEAATYLYGNPSDVFFLKTGSRN